MALRGNFFRMFESKKQKVSLKSGFKSIFAGVLQGSVLGPLLFWTSFILVYINDIAKHLLSLKRLFADESSRFYSASHIAEIAGIINHELQLLIHWARQWLVTFNPLKTEAILFILNKLDFLPQLRNFLNKAIGIIKFAKSFLNVIDDTLI